MSVGSDVCEGSQENMEENDICVIIDSDDSSDEDIIEVFNEATIEDMFANKDCSDSQDCSRTILLHHPINSTKPNDFSSYVGQRLLSDHEQQLPIILSQLKVLAFHHTQNMAKSNPLFMLGFILLNGWSTLQLRMVFIVWYV